MSDVDIHLKHSGGLDEMAHVLLRTCGPAVTACVSSAERSRRAFYKEFVRVVEAADVILEVLDARDPLAYRCREVEQFIRSADPNKKIILLLNKIGKCASGGCRHACTLLSTAQRSSISPASAGSTS